MSILCGCCPLLECVYCLGCARWAYKRCLYTAGHDSKDWGLATTDKFEPVPRFCRYILAVYEEDIRNPVWEPPEGYGINPDWLLLRKTYEDTQGRAPAYILYLDHDHKDVVVAIRGLNLAKESDYALLMDNKLGKRKFDGGYVHNGLLKSAGWVLDEECKVLKELVVKYPSYTLTFAGHSLGSGVATMLALLVVRHPDRLGNIDRKRVRCFAIAPARCMSLNLAVRYADVINSVVLQDDFLPRTATPLEDIFKSLFCQTSDLTLITHRDQVSYWLYLLSAGIFGAMYRQKKVVESTFVHTNMYCNGNLVGWKWIQPKCVPGCLLFHLETFMWTMYQWQGENEKEVASYILKNARRLKKATLSTKPIKPEELKKLEWRREVLNELASEARASMLCHLESSMQNKMLQQSQLQWGYSNVMKL
ncbi:unnamed protein product [Arabis nemorensis]|uniref:FBD domain-containing protein n=1 Tax=Arabis nemorensis TaxID=586526 RepID=A0A565AW95_9BRAS|nr:unnamed protein product [Arabis nemorensis]